ncbi:cyclic lactone autoinducer peptide [Thermanaeromonas toyohensis ToBE]|uniref:Cyclic lactone autoinducer peptide n=1 Tax=Thermanaeromonas toyohensis ToBE TaxID=698762 RepID=A0A1W1W3H7_9FIRM|nr:cyclic lactone autoinducer peptide [Thermanaeromonas toyohensis]SMC00010.1 cyclic lactone autoinducer peptide [Thermanaeromonas toyohensis ToBE]
MKRLVYRLLPTIFSFLALAAAVGVKPTCAFFWYQPEVPKALRK